MRDEQPRRAAVLGLERLAVGRVGDQRRMLEHVGQRQVGRVAAVAVGQQVAWPPAVGPARVEQRRDRDARASRIPNFDQRVTQWMSPSQSVARRGLKRRPVQRRTAPRTAPSIDSSHSSVGDLRGLADRQHRPLDRRRLAGRQPVGIDPERLCAPAAAVSEHPRRDRHRFHSAHRRLASWTEPKDQDRGRRQMATHASDSGQGAGRRLRAGGAGRPEPGAGRGAGHASTPAACATATRSPRRAATPASSTRCPRP